MSRTFEMLFSFLMTADEAAFFRDADAAGYILFKRNCETPEQVTRLTDALRSITGRPDLPILIDQEGGRVARMRPPEWPAFQARPAERAASRPPRRPERRSALTPGRPITHSSGGSNGRQP